jgi:hypothetical protein
MTNKTPTLESLRITLAESGFKNVSVHKSGYLIVKDSDAVKVQININSRGTVRVDKKFPQIGSSVQVVSTLLFLIIGFMGVLPYPIVSAVILGQLISVFWFLPKVNNLLKEVENVIS